jgi:hypothetical protein
MQAFIGLVAFGVAFIISRFVTVWLFTQVSPPPPGGTRWDWWGTYVSILLSLIIATAVMAMVERRTRAGRGGYGPRP